MCATRHYSDLVAALVVLSISCFVVPSAHADLICFDGKTGERIRTLVPEGSGGLSGSIDVVFHSDSVYLSSYYTRDILRYDATTGTFLGQFVSPGSGGLFPEGSFLFGPDGNLYATSFNFFSPNRANDAVLRYDGTTGAFINTFVQPSSVLLGPHGLTFGPDGNLYVSTFFSNSVLRYNGTTGAFLGAFVPAGSGGLNGATNLVFGPDGNLYVSSLRTDSVLRYNGTTGAFLGAFVPAGSGGLSRPHDLIFGPDSNLYVTSFDPSGLPNAYDSSVLRYDGTTGAFLNTFVPPDGVHYNSGMGFGPDGNFYVAAELIIPEPSAFVLLGIGTLCLLGCMWRCRKQATA